MPAFDPKAEAPTYELLTGDYPFEIVNVENKMSGGTKTNGCQARELTLFVYRDETFREKIAKVQDTLIDHESCNWKYSVLAKCVDSQLQPGVNFDITPDWRGYRGRANFKPEPGKQDPSKLWNRVQRYIVDGRVLPPNPKPQVKQPAARTAEVSGNENPFNEDSTSGW